MCFRDALSEGDARSTATSYVRFARQLERLGDDEILLEYPELLAAPSPERTVSDLESYVGLLRRHAAGVLSVLSERLAENAEALARGDLPATCLLVMTASDSETEPKAEFVHSQTYRSVRWRGEQF